MNKIFIISIQILILILFSTCEDRPRNNPFDPETDLAPAEWAPSNLQAQVLNDSEIKLTWVQEETRIAGFRIERQVNSGSFTQIAEVGANVTEYTDTGLNYGTDYTYRVKAFTDENESAYATSNMTNTSFPSPTNPIATPVDDQSIQLTWTDNCSFESGFRLERSTGGYLTQIAEVGEDITEYADTGLTLDTDYTYRVKAFTDENESGYATSNTTNTSFPSPTNLTATPIDDQSIQLTWVDNCSFESGFRLERPTGGNFTQIAEVDEDITEYIDTGLNYGTDYTYRVKAFTDENESEYTNTVEMTLFYDCAGEFMGTAIEDCAGECNGTAFVNACDYCVGGNTGIDENYCSTLTDIDGNEYETIIIGDQVWMAENLKVTHYRNGDAIHTDRYAIYDNNESNADTYGYLYKWFAVDDSRNIAPEGWHVPTDAEWTILTDYLGGESVAGGKMKETGTEHWNSPNTGATNESGFTALPGGYRYPDGDYYNMGLNGYFWSSSIDYPGAWYRKLNYNNSGVNRKSEDAGGMDYGFSVRCVRTVE